MSTLNQLGWTVKRKRQGETTGSPSSKSGLAFGLPESMSPPAKPQIVRPRPKNKQPQKNTLLQYLQPATSKPSAPSITPLSPPSPAPVQAHHSVLLHTTTPPPCQPESPSSQPDEQMICLVRHSIPWLNYWPLLEDSFGQSMYNDEPSPTIHHPSLKKLPTTSSLTLKKKTPVEPIVTSDVSTNAQCRRRRRDQVEDNDEPLLEDMNAMDEDSLPRVFTHAMILTSNKQLCGARSRQRRQQPASSMWQDGYVQDHASLDHLVQEFSRDQANDHPDDDEPERVALRHPLTRPQTSQLLMSIADEYLLFENNTWCQTYLR
ncbi:hypothetical protein DM01DRAFT_1407796 [Hesseltinella vesiculosa]|uniref:Uncharacterized protein n=1 Tax=Hesseltinella vesiculosa TaxID=101127 RepID=A0A1X2GH56_9FUNG|nr:hypothetical protein DM01DRAFT_1407796 [Hesseltinella vesiculosa]